jgi:hypothetical protein
MHTKQSTQNVESQRKNGILGSQLPRFVSLAICAIEKERERRKNKT